MSNNIGITINDFENICRTCLSKEDLKPLYEKCSSSTCLVEFLISCTFIKFTEDDGLPIQICKNCINDINQAFSFTKRCKTVDTFLRNCVKNFKTGLANNSSRSQIVEPIIKAEDEIKIEIKSEINLPNIHERVKEIEYVSLKQNHNLEEVEQNENVKIEYEEHNIEVKMEIDEIFDDPAWCNFCNKKIRCQSMNLHMKTHTGFPPIYQCKTCKNFFKTLNLLKIHQRVHTGDEHDEVQIKYEELVVFKQEEELIIENESDEISDPADDSYEEDQNEEIHTSDRPYTCEICNKAFKDFWSRKKHMRIHTGEKPYICKVCSKTFNRSTSLKIHMRIHTGEKPYTCEVCSKAFAQSVHLKTHMRKHTGEKPYTCELCSKAFTRFGILKVHKRTHTGEKPYTCEVCSMAFAQTVQLKAHMRMHTGEKPYMCEFCSKTFAISSCFKRHIRMHTMK